MPMTSIHSLAMGVQINGKDSHQQRENLGQASQNAGGKILREGKGRTSKR